MTSRDNLNEALINGMIAVRWVLYTATLKSDEEINTAVSNVRRSARIAAHYAIAHLNQGGRAPLPMSQAARERLIGLIQASIYGLPRALKSIAGGGKSRPVIRAKPVSVAARKAKAAKPSGNGQIPSPPIRPASEKKKSLPIHVSEEDWILKKRLRLDLKTAPSPELVGGELVDALGKIIHGALLLKNCVREPTISPELADALGSIVRGARLSRDCIRKRNMFFLR